MVEYTLAHGHSSGTVWRKIERAHGTLRGAPAVRAGAPCVVRVGKLVALCVLARTLTSRANIMARAFLSQVIHGNLSAIANRGGAIDGSPSRVDSLIQRASTTALIFPAAAAGTRVIPVGNN